MKAAPSKKIDWSSIKAAVASSNKSSRAAIKQGFSDLGIKNAQSYSTTPETLKGVLEIKVDLLVVDRDLDSTGAGVEVILKMRKDTATQEAACILLSAKVDQGKVATAVESEIDEFLAVPFTNESLKDAITRAVTRRKTPSLYQVAIKSACEMIKDRKFDEAVKILESALSQDAQPVTAYYHLGYIKMVHGKLEEALAFFEKGLKLRPNNLNCMFGKTFVFKSLERKDEFFENLKAILEVYPTHIGTLCEIIPLLISKKEVDQAWERLTFCLKSRSDFPKLDPVVEENTCSLIKKTSIPVLKKLMDEALPLFRTFCKERKEFTVQLIRVLNKFEQEKAASDLYTQYKADFGESFEVEMDYANLLFDKGETDRCIGFCRQVRDKFSDRIPTLELLEKCYLKASNQRQLENVRMDLDFLRKKVAQETAASSESKEESQTEEKKSA